MSETEQQPATGEATADTASRWEDLIDVFISPAELFRRRAQDRGGVPLLMLLGTTVALYVVLLPANRIIARASLPADAEAAAFMEQFGGLFQLLGVIFAPVSTLVTVAFSAVLVWAFASLLGTGLSASRAFVISTYAAFVLLLGHVAAAVLVLVQSGDVINLARDLSLGPLRFAGVGAESPLVPLLRRFELFSIWQAALWGVGVRQIAATSAGTAAAVAGLAWACYALPTLLFALLGPGGH